MNTFLATCVAAVALCVAVALAAPAPQDRFLPGMQPVRVMAREDVDVDAREHRIWSRAGASAAAMDCAAVADWTLYNVGGPLLASSAFSEKLRRPYVERSALGGKRQVNALFLVDGVAGQDAAGFASTLTSSTGAESAKLLNLETKTCCGTETSLNDDSVAFATSLARGAPSSSHGVTSAEWALFNGRTSVQAYRGGAWPSATAFPSTADALLQDWTEHFHHRVGKAPTVVAASGSYAMAAALAASPTVAAASGLATVAGLFWNKQVSAMSSIYGVAPTEVTEAMVLARAAQEGNALFDAAADSADFALFAELELLRAATQVAVQAEGKVLFNFAFSSTHDLAPAKRAAAAKIISAAIAETLAQLDSTFGETVDAQVVFADTRRTEVVTAGTGLEDVMFKATQQDVSRFAFAKFFPTFFADVSGNTDHLCEVVSQALEAYPNLAVVCPPSNPALVFSIMQANRSNNSNTTPTPTPTPTDDSEDQARFNIVLWTSILLIAIVYAIFYYMYALDVGEDDLLYRMSTTGGGARDKFDME